MAPRCAVGDPPSLAGELHAAAASATMTVVNAAAARRALTRPGARGALATRRT
jgi:hypothetical protein